LSSPIDLSTSQGRRRARSELMWGDHGFLRLRFHNLHQISAEMWRANQPSPGQIARYARELGVRTILNLRGASPKGYYLLEREACEQNGVRLVDFQMFSRDCPTKDTVLAARDLFETIAYPALMHCKSGADRAGIMAVLYMHFRMKQPIEQAVSQLSRRYLHIREGKTGMLDFFFATYLREGAPAGLSFTRWIETVYDRDAVKAAFMKSFTSRLNLDRILARE